MEKKLLNHELPIYDWMFEKYGIKITGEPMDSKHNLLTTNNGIVAKYYTLNEGLVVNKSNYLELKRDIRKYSNVPALKNYLYGYYIKKEKYGSAKKILRKILKEHPDYAFGKTALIDEYIREGKLEKVEEMIPEDFMDIHAFLNYPPDLTLHESIVRSYFGALTLYYCESHNIDLALKCHRILYDLNQDHPICKSLAMRVNMLKSMQFFIDDEKYEREVEAPNPTVFFEQRTERPVLRHDELYQLYEYGYRDHKMTKEVIDQVMALPRETLIADLEKILMDTLHRFDYWEEGLWKRLEDSKEKYDSYVHAVYFLGALKATESRDVFLDVLRQGSERLDLLFGDFLDKILGNAMYFMFKDDLDKVLEYIKEPNQHYWNKVLFIDMLTKIMQLEPHRKEECIVYHEKIAQFFLDHREDETLFDTRVTTALIEMPYANGLTEMLPFIKMLFDEQMVSIKMYGDYPEVEKEVKSPFHLTDLEKLPKDIYEFYSEDHSLYNQELKDKAVERLNVKPLKPEFEDEYDAYLFDSNPFGQMFEGLDEGKLESLLNKDISIPDKNTLDNPLPKRNQAARTKESIKIGRNDPCLCGSGKKYKKCCMNK